MKVELNEESLIVGNEDSHFAIEKWGDSKILITKEDEYNVIISNTEFYSKLEEWFLSVQSNKEPKDTPELFTGTHDALNKLSVGGE